MLVASVAALGMLAVSLAAISWCAAQLWHAELDWADALVIAGGELHTTQGNAHYQRISKQSEAALLLFLPGVTRRASDRVAFIPAWAGESVLAPGERFETVLFLDRALRTGDARTVARFPSLAQSDPETSAAVSLRTALARRMLAQPPDTGDLERLAELPPQLARSALEVGPAPVLRDRYRRRLPGHLPGTAEQGGLDALFDPAWLRHRALDWSREPGPAPSSLFVSLELEVQEAAARALQDEVGTIVVLDALTAQLRAAVADERTLSRFGPGAFFSERREPASIAKLVTAAAAWRAGIAVEDDIVAQPCRGAMRTDRGLLYCPSAVGELAGFDHAMAVSCNTTFARLGLQVGRAALIAEFERFGLLGAPLAPESILRTPVRGSRSLSELSIGLDQMAISVLEAALLAHTVASGGVRFEPTLVLGGGDMMGFSLHPERLPPSVEGLRVLDEDMAAGLARSMRAVTLYGTAAGIAPSGVEVAMKTGTAREPGEDFHINYIGFLPAEAPRYAFAVRVTGHPTSRRVRRAGYRVTRRLLLDLARHASDRERRGAPR